MHKISVLLLSGALFACASCNEKNWVCRCTIIVNGNTLDTTYTDLANVGENTAYDYCNQIQLDNSRSTGVSGSGAHDTVAVCPIF